jgi:K(+)-stimulated pyrophosphate-energized sodium pump
MIPVVFSALAMNSVGKPWTWCMKCVASSEIPGIMEGTGKPEYAKCVDISTKGCTKMMLPGILTIGFPISGTSWETGLWGQQSISAEMLGGYMAGVTVSSALGCFQNNAGGAWDNAKKSLKLGL